MYIKAILEFNICRLNNKVLFVHGSYLSGSKDFESIKLVCLGKTRCRNFQKYTMLPCLHLLLSSSNKAKLLKNLRRGIFGVSN